MAPARAQFVVREKVTVRKYLTTYPAAAAPAKYFRLSVLGLTTREVDRARSGGLRRTPIGGGFYAFPEPDEATFTIAVRGEGTSRFKTPSGLWRDGDRGVGETLERAGQLVPECRDFGLWGERRVNDPGGS